MSHGIINGFKNYCLRRVLLAVTDAKRKVSCGFTPMVSNTETSRPEVYLQRCRREIVTPLNKGHFGLQGIEIGSKKQVERQREIPNQNELKCSRRDEIALEMRS